MWYPVITFADSATSISLFSISMAITGLLAEESKKMKNGRKKQKKKRRIVGVECNRKIRRSIHGENPVRLKRSEK
jgi:hypothetical protein